MTSLDGDEETKALKLTVSFYDTKHERQGGFSLNKHVRLSDSVQETIRTQMQEVLEQLKWTTQTLWAEHEKVDEKFIFADLWYLVRGDTLNLECEPPSCPPRLLQSLLLSARECVHCNKAGTLTGLPCLHFVVCEPCLVALGHCPICHRRDLRQIK